MSVTYSCAGVFCEHPDGGPFEFDEKDEYDAHADKHHPLTCTNWRCHDLAAYKYFPGKYGSYFYCASCAAESWPDNATMRERIKRVTRTVNVKNAETLPDDHPIEQTLETGEIVVGPNDDFQRCSECEFRVVRSWEHCAHCGAEL